MEDTTPRLSAVHIHLALAGSHSDTVRHVHGAYVAPLVGETSPLHSLAGVRRKNQRIKLNASLLGALSSGNGCCRVFRIYMFFGRTAGHRLA